MFKNPFSFEGRIRRLEYLISSILSTIAAQFLIFFAFAGLVAHGISGMFFLLFLGYIPLLWFAISQNAKRCHDRGNSGWYQLIPLYILFLLFAPGEIGDNRFGEDPKESEDNY